MIQEVIDEVGDGIDDFEDVLAHAEGVEVGGWRAVEVAYRSWQVVGDRLLHSLKNSIAGRTPWL